MTALIILGSVAGALVSTAFVVWIAAQTTGTRMQEWRNRQ